MVNVELDTDEYGNVQFGMKDTPLARSSIRVLARKLNRSLSILSRQLVAADEAKVV